jgi:putative hydroxymethylpyrimidine transport system substrate-binding protein
MPRRLLPLIALMALAAGCGSSSGAATSNGAVQQDLSLQLDWYPNPDHVGLYTAIDRGFFRRAGLDVTPRQPTDVSDPIKLVAAGRADLGISYEPELFFAQQQHAPVVAVAAIVPTALNSIITTEQGITTPAGLRGKTIGVDGSASTSAYVDTVLRTAGLAPGDVHSVTVGFNLLPAIVFLMQSLEGLMAYGKRLFALRAGLGEVHDRAPSARPTPFGLAIVERLARALGPFGQG